MRGSNYWRLSTGEFLRPITGKLAGLPGFAAVAALVDPPTLGIPGELSVVAFVADASEDVVGFCGNRRQSRKSVRSGRRS